MTWKARSKYPASHDVSWSIAALRMRMNSPSVRMMNGSESNRRDGTDQRVDEAEDQGDDEYRPDGRAGAHVVAEGDAGNGPRGDPEGDAVDDGLDREVDEHGLSVPRARARRREGRGDWSPGIRGWNIWLSRSSSGSTILSDPTASATGTRTMWPFCSATIWPQALSSAASTAATPKRVPSTRSNATGEPPRWMCPSAVMRPQKTGGEVQQRGLAAARGADDRDEFAGSDVQREFRHRCQLGGFERHRHLVEDDRARRRLCYGTGAGSHLRWVHGHIHCLLFHSSPHQGVCGALSHSTRLASTFTSMILFSRLKSMISCSAETLTFRSLL